MAVCARINPFPIKQTFRCNVLLFATIHTINVTNHMLSQICHICFVSIFMFVYMSSLENIIRYLTTLPQKGEPLEWKRIYLNVTSRPKTSRLSPKDCSDCNAEKVLLTLLCLNLLFLWLNTFLNLCSCSYSTIAFHFRLYFKL